MYLNKVSLFRSEVKFLSHIKCLYTEFVDNWETDFITQCIVFFTMQYQISWRLMYYELKWKCCYILYLMLIYNTHIFYRFRFCCSWSSSCSLGNHYSHLNRCFVFHMLLLKSGRWWWWWWWKELFKEIGRMHRFDVSIFW